MIKNSLVQYTKNGTIALFRNDDRAYCINDLTRSKICSSICPSFNLRKGKGRRIDDPEYGGDVWYILSLDCQERDHIFRFNKILSEAPST
jgi:hypothetical protein